MNAKLKWQIHWSFNVICIYLWLIMLHIETQTIVKVFDVVVIAMFMYGAYKAARHLEKTYFD